MAVDKFLFKYTVNMFWPLTLSLFVCHCCGPQFALGHWMQLVQTCAHMVITHLYSWGGGGVICVFCLFSSNFSFWPLLALKTPTHPNKRHAWDSLAHPKHSSLLSFLCGHFVSHCPAHGNHGSRKWYPLALALCIQYIETFIHWCPPGRLCLWVYVV